MTGNHWLPDTRIGYIDGDLIAYAAAAKMNEETHYQPTLNYIDDNLNSLKYKLNLDAYFVYLTGAGNFRKEVYPEYKANRKAKEVPRYLSTAKIFLIQEKGAILSQGLEADDLLGMALTKHPEGLLISHDKDLDQIPGWHYSPYHDKMYHVTPEQAERFLARQCLSGDSTDNIPGIKGIGPKKAEKILGEEGTFREYMTKAWRAYLDHDMDYATFCQYYKCVKILKHSDDDYSELAQAKEDVNVTESNYE